MIPPFATHKLIVKLIPIQALSTRAALISLSIFAHYLLLTCAFTSVHKNQTHHHHHPQTSAMKVHPMPRTRVSGKNLRRLPHIFSRVLELPFGSDADVSIEESPECFRFVAKTDCVDDVRAHTIEIYPGVTKIVIRDSGFVGLSLDELELDRWRFRLPESTLPELASAACVDGELVVTVPKMEGGSDAEDGEGDGCGEFRGDMSGRLVLVQ